MLTGYLSDRYCRRFGFSLLKFGFLFIVAFAAIVSDARAATRRLRSSPWSAGLKEGVNWGIAARYPDDRGIKRSRYVIAAEGFESGRVSIRTEEDRYRKHVKVTRYEPVTGRFCALNFWQEGVKGLTCRVPLKPPRKSRYSRPASFVRMYFRYDRSFNGGDKPVGVKGFGIYCESPGGKGRQKPVVGTKVLDGASTQFVGWGGSSKPEANDGFLWVGHLYSYSPHPRNAEAVVGKITRRSAVRFSAYSDPYKYIRFGEWYCYEVGLYLNTPGKSDGEARFWINGVLQCRVTHMRYCDIRNLYPTCVYLNLYRTTPDFPQTMKRWVDNIVIARRYIGPVRLSRRTLARLKKYGIVVHTASAEDVEAMRKAAQKKKHRKPRRR